MYDVLYVFNYYRYIGINCDLGSITYRVFKQLELPVKYLLLLLLFAAQPPLALNGAAG